MARQIIILDVSDKPNGDYEVSAVAWLVAPANRKLPRPGFTSKVPLQAAVSWGVTAAELAFLQDGTFVEVDLFSGLYPSGITKGDAQVDLKARYDALQAVLTASAIGQNFIGGSRDSATGWNF